MHKREKEILFEIFSLYISGSAPNVAAYRSKQADGDLDKIDRLVTMQYMENKDNFYRIKPLRVLTLDHPLVDSEKKILNSLLPRLIEMFMSNYQMPKFTRTQIQTGQTTCEHLTDIEIARALVYLKEAWILEVVSSDDTGFPFVFRLDERIRKAKNADLLIPDHVKPYDLGRAERARHDANRKVMLASLTGGGMQDEFDFSWIRDKRLRENSVSDWKEATSALQSGFWKSAIVFAGSTMEGLLLAAIVGCRGESQKRLIAVFLSGESKPGKKLTAYDLYFRQLIQLAKTLEIISSGPQKFSHSVNDYRNLIHPGTLMRDASLRAGKPEAEAASSAVSMLNRDIKDFRSKRAKRSYPMPLPQSAPRKKPTIIILQDNNTD